jgi:hypothetical protein
LRPIAIATFGAWLLLWLAGIVRGEVGRLWIYFGPLVVLLAIGWNEERVNRHSSRSSFYVAIIVLLAAQLLVMNTRWLVNDSFLDEPPERSVVLSAPPMPFTASAEFADQIALRGYDIHSTGRAVEANLLWQALAQPPHAYAVFTHVVDANGQQVGQQDNMPVRDQSPTSCWLPGEYVSDPYFIPLAADARRPFKLVVGMYRVDTGERLSRSDAQGDSATLTVP